MRGQDDRSEGFFSYVRLEERIPSDHPLRQIRAMTDAALRELSRDFEQLAREALDTERETVIALRNEDTINDEVLRRIQHDIDLAEARLERHR